MGILTLLKKDLKIVLSDKKALIILVAMPIILYTILSFALSGSFGSSDGDIWDINIGIVKGYDLEDSVNDFLTLEDAESIDEILFEILDSDELSFITYEFYTREEAIEMVKNNELASVIILPESYINDLAINMSPSFRKPLTIEIIKNTERQYSSSIVENIVTGITDRLSQVMTINKVTYETLKHYDVRTEIVDQVMEGFRDAEQESVEVKSSLFKIDKLKTVTSGQYYSTAMMAMFLLFGASYGAKFMLQEKRDFTLQRQQSAGISSAKIVFGKLALIFCIAVMQIALMIATSTIGFGVYWGKPLSLVVVTLLTAIAVTGFGTLLAAVSLKAGDLKVLNMMESGIFQILALFGGSYFPLFLMPEWFKWISRILLNGAALDIYQKVMMDAPMIELLPSALSLFINAAVFLSIGMFIIVKAPKNTIAVSQEEVTA